MRHSLMNADRLTLAESRALEQQYDGAIPASAVAHAIAQRGTPAPEPTIDDLIGRLKYVRSELAREGAKETALRIALVDAVAEWDVAPAHDKGRCHNIVQSKRKQVQAQCDVVAVLLGAEDTLADMITERAEAAIREAE